MSVVIIESRNINFISAGISENQNIKFISVVINERQIGYSLEGENR